VEEDWDFTHTELGRGIYILRHERTMKKSSRNVAKMKGKGR
jgi:hypothetical protein